MPTFVNIDDLRRAAKWNLPKAIFDFVDGGANAEWTMRRNQSAFERILFDPRVCVDVSDRDQSTTVFGQPMKTPILIGATGLTSIAWPNAELLAARAAERVGAGLALSTYASNSLEEVAKTGVNPRWFQLYVSRDRKKTDELIDRAQAAGYQALAITVDTQVPSMRERNVRNGYQAPPRITASNVVDVAWRVGWLKRFLKGPRPAYRNISGEAALTPKQFVELGYQLAREIDPSVSWKDVENFRARWKGPMLLKGVVSTRDVKTALDAGINGFIVSNHGGRQLDYAPSSIEVLARDRGRLRGPRRGLPRQRHPARQRHRQGRRARGEGGADRPTVRLRPRRGRRGRRGPRLPDPHGRDRPLPGADRHPEAVRRDAGGPPRGPDAAARRAARGGAGPGPVGFSPPRPLALSLWERAG